MSVLAVALAQKISLVLVAVHALIGALGLLPPMPRRGAESDGRGLVAVTLLSPLLNDLGAG